MKKTSKFLSAILALAMALALAVPAFAAATYAGAQLHPSGSWGSGPSLTLTGVTRERAVKVEIGYCYDVEVGGSLVLDMPFPAGENRSYRIFAAGVYVTPDFAAYADNGLSWDVPAASEGGMFDQSSGKSQYVYNFTEADMGQAYGYEKAIYMDVYWDTDPDGDGYTNDSGSAYFYIHVVPAGTTSSTPATPTQPSTPDTPTTPAQPSTSTTVKPAPGVSVALNDGSGEFAYTIKSGDTLSSIAAYYYGNVNVYKLIYERNKDILKSANAIYAGQTITLPSYAAVASTPPSTSTPSAGTATAYTVKSGDNLSKIAKAFYGDAAKWKTIYEANKSTISNPNVIRAGQVLTIPAQ